MIFSQCVDVIVHNGLTSINVVSKFIYDNQVLCERLYYEIQVSEAVFNKNVENLILGTLSLWFGAFESNAVKILSTALKKINREKPNDHLLLFFYGNT